MNRRRETYLGDGVYASYDGYQLIVRAEMNEVFIDANVLDSLFRYLEKVTKKKIVILDDDKGPEGA
jgi:hypothetical protein